MAPTLFPAKYASKIAGMRSARVNSTVVCDDVGDRLRELVDAHAEVAVKERVPKAQVLLPPRPVEAEGLHIQVVGGVVGLWLQASSSTRAADRVPGNQAGKKPVDRGRDPEGRSRR